MALTKFGEQTKSVFLKAIEAHKLHQEFEVTATKAVIKGQPVVLAADGTIQTAESGEKAYKIIGYSLHTRAAGELATIAMKAMAIVWSQSAGALSAGPVKFSATPPTDPFYASYLAPTAVDQATTPVLDGSDVVGYALDAATGADELVRVAIL